VWGGGGWRPLSLSLSLRLFSHLSLSLFRECRPRREVESNTQYFRTFVLAALAAALPAFVGARGGAGGVVSLTVQRLKAAAVLKHDAIACSRANAEQVLFNGILKRRARMTTVMASR